jgi:hypothetical protein
MAPLIFMRFEVAVEMILPLIDPGTKMTFVAVHNAVRGQTVRYCRIFGPEVLIRGKLHTEFIERAIDRNIQEKMGAADARSLHQTNKLCEG